MDEQLEMQKQHALYVGDIVNNLIRESAYWKTKFNAINAENEKLKESLNNKPNEPYINDL
jgi:hypothetical protein